TDGPDWRLRVEGKVQSALVWRSNSMAFARLGLINVEFGIHDPMQEAGGAQAGGDVVLAPMPGLVQTVSVSVGDVVKQGDPLMVLEAMKMEHALVAPRDGMVEAVLAVQGAQVDAGALLVRLEEVV
ncbi:MAG: biotin/lipoyl-binding protein, partial [Rhodobacteraceae bacterium]|nr:biotin/lipoyl-binding protein [Paracoccaceae bacterium]